jgi:hypothetical protein
MPIHPIYEPDNPANGNPPQKAYAILKKGQMDGGQKATINPIGFVNGICPYHHQRGHLIGNDLGGKNDRRNLVTLTDGSNHPAMYAMERIVKKIVEDGKGREFDYVVIADYDINLYQKCQNGVRGAAGNPFCTPPDVPAQLRIGLTAKGSAKSLLDDLDLLKHYDDAKKVTAKWKEFMTRDGFFCVGNGMYKEHKNPNNHVPTCAARGTYLGDAVPKCATCARKGKSIRLYGATDWGWGLDYWHYCAGCNRLFCSTCAATLTGTFYSWRKKCGNHPPISAAYWTELFVVDSK